MAYIGSYQQYTVTAAGMNIQVDAQDSPDILAIFPDSGSVTLLGDVSVTWTNGNPPQGTILKIVIISDFELNGRTITIFGQNVNQYQVNDSRNWIFEISARDNAASLFINDGPYSLSQASNPPLNGDKLIDESVTLAKLEDLARGNIIVGNSTNRPTAVDFNNSGYIGIGDGTDYNSVAQSGDVIFSTAGVSAIQTGVIVNADVNASAAIARTKLASGTADYVVINSGTGVMSQEAQLANSRGGTGLDSSASTGFPTISSGTWSASAIAVDRDLDVSFEAGEVGDFKIYMGFAGTLTNIYAFATKVIAGTDNGTIVPKNNAGTTMATGTVTFTASDARGTAYTVTPSTNNTFVAGDILTFTTAKTTAGGKVHLSLKFTRTA